jgi:hypothetical protein
MKDCKIIFNTRSYHYIFVKQIKDDNYLQYYFNNLIEIQNEKSFFLMMPNPIELKKFDSSEAVRKYAPALKEFMEDDTKNTLFTEEDILKSIIKEEKRSNFFKFLIKKKKNIVLFCHKDLDFNANPDNYTSIYMNTEDLIKQESLFKKFDDIKEAIKKTHNPFKNPFEAFSKIESENI